MQSLENRESLWKKHINWNLPFPKNKIVLQIFYLMQYIEPVLI